MKKRTSRSPRSVAYTYLIGDLLHYGHILLLKQAAAEADLHICGVVSDEAARSWQVPIIQNFSERAGVIETLDCVDEVMIQETLDPTPNLSAIHKRFPLARVVFFRGHQSWPDMPGVSFVRRIGGKIVRPDYYPRLSRERVARAFTSPDLSGIDPVPGLSLTKSIYYGVEPAGKGRTLERLRPRLRHSRIEPVFLFTVKEWRGDPEDLRRAVLAAFPGRSIVVRSSARGEDSIRLSMAGAHASVIGIDPSDRDAFQGAVEAVISSYGPGGAEDDEEILIQPRVGRTRMSGVVLTRRLGTNEPYYVINHDEITGRTDTVTGGLAGGKVEILRSAPLSRIRPKFRRIIRAVREIEALLEGLVLDIEFAVDGRGRVTIFQVRPLAANRASGRPDPAIEAAVDGILATYRAAAASIPRLVPGLVLSDMAFWNPAEIIGERARPLAASLYRDLILRSRWNEGLRNLGYTPVDEPLILMIGNKPYIVLHHALLSLVPADLPGGIKRRLVAAYHDRIKKNPSSHDKIEFEIVHDIMHFDFEGEREVLAGEGFGKRDIRRISESLTNLTARAIRAAPRLLRADKRAYSILARRRRRLRSTSRLDAARRLLDDCAELAAAPFARQARLAFIGKKLIESAARVDPLCRDLAPRFLSSIRTVITNFHSDSLRLAAGRLGRDRFLARYGHLRPGTYDIDSMPYSSMDGILSAHRAAPSGGRRRFGRKERRLLSERLGILSGRSGLPIGGERILAFTESAQRTREAFKLEFTRNISAALELMADEGASLGFGREELSYLDTPAVLAAAGREAYEVKALWRPLIEAREEEWRLLERIPMPDLVFQEDDFICIERVSAEPTFTTRKRVTGPVVLLTRSGPRRGLAGKIVLIESADPGYDWIFSRGIKGLITRFGGAASHMAIRAAEMALPAAIGSGEVIFDRASRASRVLLDAENRKIEVLG